MTLEGVRPKLVASASTKTFACDDAEVQQGEVAKPGRRWVRAAWIVGLAAFAGVWAFGFWYDTHRPKPEPLDATSMRAANADCQAAISSLSAIPPVGAAPTVENRATRDRDENAVFTALVTRLRRIHPTDRDGADALAGFTADWQHLTTARERYVTALLAGPGRPKLYIPVDPTGAPVTIRMGEYARIHELNDCTPDSLQGEVVEGPRAYPRVP